ncbi:endospore germination permease [Paenibacillus lautus]|uniref:GerAB/ArcD/ProY family transporter n=1 Tax=Paenibacillus lautus TaxID=1401 RepID=UPI002DBA4627|nr:endospore germination permease [Paenibacillus lautus]MEC0206949.1 endospore germination permease [Paenibacillus lautus]
MLKSITSNQIFSLYNLSIFTTSIAFMLGITIAGARYSNPLAAVLGAFLALVLIYPAYKVGTSKPDKFFVEFGAEIVGKPLHTLFVLFKVLFMLLLATINERNLTGFLLSEYLSGTPAWSIVLTISICVAYAVRSGLSTIFRMAQGIFLISVFAFLIIPLLTIREVEPDMLVALVTHLNPYHLANGMYLHMGLFGELAFLFMLVPYLKKPKKVYRVYLITTCTSLIIVLSHMIPVLLTFGPKLGANLIYPDLDLVRFLRVGTYIEALDPILIILWLTSLFTKISFFLFIVAMCLSQLCGIKDYKTLTMPVIAFVSVFSLVLVRSQAEMFEFLTRDFTLILITSEFLIPGIYWLVSAIRSPQEREGQTEAKSVDS